MPGMCSYSRHRRKTWAMMDRSDRKAWHRAESLRLLNGFKPRAKP